MIEEWDEDIDVDLSILPTPFDLLVKAQEFFDAEENLHWAACVGFASNHYGAISSQRSNEERWQIEKVSNEVLDLMVDQMDPRKAFGRAIAVAEVLYK